MKTQATEPADTVMDDSIGRRNLKVKSWGRMVSVRSQSLPMIDNIPAFFDDASNGRMDTAKKPASNRGISMKTDLVYVRSTKLLTSDEDIHCKATSTTLGLCNFEALASESYSKRNWADTGATGAGSQIHGKAT